MKRGSAILKKRKLLLPRIISGGQTGVDRAALDLALALELSCGGWCPRGRRAEDGKLDSRYPLTETPAGAYAQRTEWNVRDSDGTLVLHRGPRTGGTALTLKVALLKKPCLALDLSSVPSPSAVRRWLKKNKIEALNVAGPRESQKQGIYRQAVAFLQAALAPR